MRWLQIGFGFKSILCFLLRDSLAFAFTFTFDLNFYIFIDSGGDRLGFFIWVSVSCRGCCSKGECGAY